MNSLHSTNLATIHMTLLVDPPAPHQPAASRCTRQTTTRNPSQLTPDPGTVVICRKIPKISGYLPSIRVLPEMIDSCYGLLVETTRDRAPRKARQEGWDPLGARNRPSYATEGNGGKPQRRTEPDPYRTTVADRRAGNGTTQQGNRGA